MKPNACFNSLGNNYLFAEVERRTQLYLSENPDAKLIKLGIGDVTRPLAPVVVEAMEKAAKEQGSAKSFMGYGPYEGYLFLREAIRRYYERRGVMLGTDEIFVSDGAKSDCGNLLDIFESGITALISDPVYPVYVDTNIMRGNKVITAAASAENGFLPMPDESVSPDIIYICSPNNPTGAAYNKEQLKAWVDYAKDTGAVILFDAAYECFIEDEDVPHSIFEIEGAKECAIEICSLSKTAGFTGTRCGYTVIPKALVSSGVSLASLWLRRQSTKFNGVSYVTQRGAEAVFSPEGMAQCLENVAYYKENARIIAAALDSRGIYYTGGKNSPYLWFRCPGTDDSWSYFEQLLRGFGIVTTPGVGFGENGAGYCRVTAFGSRESSAAAAALLSKK